MSGLEEKAKQRVLSEKRKAPKLIIGDPMPSTSSFVKTKNVEAAIQRVLGEKRKAPKLIIGDPVTSTSSFVKETTIKLDPSAGERGVGLGSKPGAGVTIGSRTSQKRWKKKGRITKEMGRRRHR